MEEERFTPEGGKVHHGGEKAHHGQNMVVYTLGSFQIFVTAFH